MENRVSHLPYTEYEDFDLESEAYAIDYRAANIGAGAGVEAPQRCQPARTLHLLSH